MKKLLPFIFICSLPLATSATEADSLLNYRMDNIVVTATRTPLPLKNTPVLTRVISSAYIERQGIGTLENLLERELAGVEFHQAGYGTTLSFQGLDARYVLFLIDGERMAGETYGNMDYTRIPLSSIERIEIVRGASSVLYGSNAMGAVVNIITKEPREKFEVSGSFRYGTRFQGNGDETLGGAADGSAVEKYRGKLDLPNIKADLNVGFNTGKLRSLTTASWRSMDAYKLRGTENELRHYGTLTKMRPDMSGGAMHFDESGIPVFVEAGKVSDTTLSVVPDGRGLGISGGRDWSVGQKLDYELSDKFRFKLSGNYTNRNRYDFNTSIMDDNPMSGIFGGSDKWAYYKTATYNVRALMEHSPDERNKIYLSFNRDESRRDVDSLVSVTRKQRHGYNDSRLLWTLEAGRWNRLTTGVEFINERLRFDLNPNGFDDVKNINSLAIYSQDEILSGRKLSFVAGIRGEWSDKFGWRVTPKFSAMCNTGNFSVRANYSNGYRTPSLKEMYMLMEIPVASAPTIEGNPGLKAESNHFLSLSLEYNLDWLNTSATVYKSYFRNKIDVVYTSGENDRTILRYENINRSESASLELISRIRIARGLIFSGNYNYIFQKTDDAPEGATQYIFPSPHTATFGLGYSFPVKKSRVSLNAGVRYIGAKDYDDLMPYINIPDAAASYIKEVVSGNYRQPTMEERIALAGIEYFTGNYKAHHKGYAICNFSADLELRRNITFTLGVDNIFDYRPRVVNFNSALVAGVNGFVKMSFRVW